MQTVLQSLKNLALDSSLKKSQCRSHFGVGVPNTCIISASKFNKSKKRREWIALSRQGGTQQQRLELPTVTPSSCNTGYIEDVPYVGLMYPVFICQQGGVTIGNTSHHRGVSYHGGGFLLLLLHLWGVGENIWPVILCLHFFFKIGD